MLGGLPFAADPSAYFFCIQPILFTELLGKIVFFWRDQNVMASNNGWKKKYKYPREIENQGQTNQNADTAKVEGIP